MSNINQVIEIIKQNVPDVRAIYIFGSSGTPFETRESDLDIAILTSTHLDSLKRWHLSQEIALAIKRDVDLISLREASTVLRIEIINSGKRIYCKDPDACDLFETAVYSSYVHFNEDRQDLLNDIKKRGGQILHG